DRRAFDWPHGACVFVHRSWPHPRYGDARPARNEAARIHVTPRVGRITLFWGATQSPRSRQHVLRELYPIGMAVDQRYCAHVLPNSFSERLMISARDRIFSDFMSRNVAIAGSSSAAGGIAECYFLDGSLYFLDTCSPNCPADSLKDQRVFSVRLVL